MSAKHSSKLNSQIKALEAMADRDIDYSDIPSISQSPERLRNGSVGKFYRPLKVQKTLRIDADVLSSFESLGRGYQTRINAVLRETVTPSEAVLVEVRAKAQKKDFEGVARLVQCAESLHPELRHYLRPRTRAAILNSLLKTNDSDFVALTKEIASEPDWWKAMEQEAGDPVAFPRVVQAAIRKINELLRRIQPKPLAKSAR
jgi:uncharacterized protein (DUF4415 family)